MHFHPYPHVPQMVDGESTRPIFQFREVAEALSTTRWDIDALVGLGYSEPVVDPATGLWIMLSK